MPTTSKPLTKAALKNYEVPYSYVKAALETNRIVNSGKINKRKRHMSPDRKKKVVVDTPGESSSEDFKTPVRRRSPRKNTIANTKSCEVSIERLSPTTIERLSPTKARRHWGSLLKAKKAKNDEVRKQATMEYNRVNMAERLVECVESLALIQEKTGLDPAGIFRMVEESRKAKRVPTMRTTQSTSTPSTSTSNTNEAHKNPVEPTMTLATEAKKKRVTFTDTTPEAKRRLVMSPSPISQTDGGATVSEADSEEEELSQVREEYKEQIAKFKKLLANTLKPGGKLKKKDIVAAMVREVADASEMDEAEKNDNETTTAEKMDAPSTSSVQPLPVVTQQTSKVDVASTSSTRTSPRKKAGTTSVDIEDLQAIATAFKNMQKEAPVDTAVADTPHVDVASTSSARFSPRNKEVPSGTDSENDIDRQASTEEIEMAVEKSMEDVETGVEKEMSKTTITTPPKITLGQVRKGRSTIEIHFDNEEPPELGIRNPLKT